MEPGFTVSSSTEVLSLAQDWEADAEVLRKYDVAGAAVAEQHASQLREAVGRILPAWLPIQVVAGRTGYSADHLRRLAKEMKPQGLARKFGSVWHFEREAAGRISKGGASQSIRPDEWADIDRLASRLAREGD